MQKLIGLLLLLIVSCTNQTNTNKNIHDLSKDNYFSSRILEYPSRDNDYKVIFEVALYISDEIKYNIEKSKIEICLAKKIISNTNDGPVIALIADKDKNDLLREDYSVELTGEENCKFGNIKRYTVYCKIAFKEIKTVKSSGICLKVNTPYGQEISTFPLK